MPCLRYLCVLYAIRSSTNQKLRSNKIQVIKISMYKSSKDEKQNNLTHFEICWHPNHGSIDPSSPLQSNEVGSEHFKYPYSINSMVSIDNLLWFTGVNYTYIPVELVPWHNTENKPTTHSFCSSKSCRLANKNQSLLYLNFKRQIMAKSTNTIVYTFRSFEFRIPSHTSTRVRSIKRSMMGERWAEIKREKSLPLRHSLNRRCMISRGGNSNKTCNFFPPKFSGKYCIGIKEI